MINVSFQGEKGAFSELAAVQYWGEDVQPVPQKSFKNVFEAVRDSRSQYGIVPIENSQTGSIHQNIDLLLEFNLAVIGEIILRIHHHLMALDGVPLESIRNVYSHPQGLQQCSDYLESLPNVECVPMYDTAGSAAFILENNIRDGAAIASLQASKDYGLNVLKEGAENNVQNFTRFLIIAPDQTICPECTKTSIVFSLKDIPGALFKAISVFALRDINLLKIESRPLAQGPWRYWFYIDFEGSLEDEACHNALNHLHEISLFLKVLGSYKQGRVIE